MISVIIPTYNSSLTIAKVLKALYNQKDVPAAEIEVLVVDDCSKDNTIEEAEKFPARIIALLKNSGPAEARNTGAREARGEILVFIDSDVILKEGALEKIRKKFIDNPTIAGLTGIYAKEAANPSLFKNYLALRKYFNWYDPKREFISFLAVSLGAIKKDVFMEYGGFDNKYRGADVEDFELGYRITEKYKIILADDIQGYHHFPGYQKTIKNFYKRSFQWMELFAKRRKFSTEAATTRKRGIANMAGFISFFFLPLGIWRTCPFIAAILAFSFFVFSNMKFYRFALSEKGIFFMFCALLFDYSFSIVVSVAAILSILNICRLNVIPK